MKRIRGVDVPFEPADPEHFVGDARVRRFPPFDGAEPVMVYLVEFEPGGRTNWHWHSARQLLLVTEGKGLVQKWDEPALEIVAGDVICIEAHEKHWHGAAAGTRMSHFAVNLNVKTAWLEPVSDDRYRAVGYEVAPFRYPP